MPRKNRTISNKVLAKQKAIIQAKLNKIQQNKSTKPNVGGNSPIFPVTEENISGNSSAQQNKPDVSQQVIPNQINQQCDANKPLPSGTAQKTGVSAISTTNEGTIYIIPKPVKSTTPLLPTPTRNVITLVGRNSTTPNQQKKILKFQMQMQARQAEQVQHRMVLKQNNLMYLNNTEMSTGMQSSMEIPRAPAPVQPPAPVQLPAPVQFPTPVHISTPVPNPPPVRDNVETVFAMDQDISFFTDITPDSTQQLLNTQQPLDTQQPLNTQQLLNTRQSAIETPNSDIESYRFRYPKGIPKSFLRSQNNIGMPTQSNVWSSYQPNVPNQTYAPNVTSPLSVQTNNQDDIAEPYSPSEIYKDIDTPQETSNKESKSSDNEQGQKRVSAFRRLGPQKQPTKPKLTISVTVNDNQEVREVVDETEEVEEITPVHLREDIILSTDETVMKYIKAWPWKRNVVVKKTVTARSSKTVMMLEKEQMEEIYEKETLFVQVTIKGYPPSWTKERVLDLLMENMRGYSFIPCFIEFNREQCKFLTLRCRSALLWLHKCGFIVRKDDVELTITLAQTDLTLNHIDFVPRIILRKRINLCIIEDTKLDLSAFTLKPDISHFIYFPLNRLYNQTELVQLQTAIKWANLTHLTLAHNRITSLDGFELEQTTPKLKHLDLSHNWLERITALLSTRHLGLKSIHLEGNPLCTDYTDPRHYVKVIRMMFPTVTTIDDVAVPLKGEMPKFIRHYCPESAKDIVEKFLEIYLPLIDGDVEHRALLKEMYDDDAYMTITYHYKLGFSTIYRSYKSMFQSARNLEENILTIIKGPGAIINNIVSWPRTEHDPGSMTIDVLYHSDSTTILRMDGILKLGRALLSDNQHLLTFSRTVVLHTENFVEYKIQSEMLYWGIPTNEYAKSAFAVTVVTPKLDLKIDSTTDESLQKELLKIFMKLTSMDKNISERCLEFKKWNLKEALDHFANLLQLNSLDALTKDF